MYPDYPAVPNDEDEEIGIEIRTEIAPAENIKAMLDRELEGLNEM